MDSLKPIKDAAAMWVSRRGGDTWSVTDEAQFQRWMDESTSHRIEFLRMEAVWQAADRLKGVGAGLRLRLCDTEHGASRSRVKQWSVAAAAVLVSAMGAWYWAARIPGKVYSTPIGVTATVPLPDGSKVMLNTESELRVAMTVQERFVELKRGEAFFEVVSDPAHPFVVKVADRRIVVLGTKFSVWRQGEHLRVVVTQGKVRIEQGEQVEGVQVPASQLAAGSIAHSLEGDVATEVRSVDEVEELLSWRSGYVVFHETSLADAAKEFNRYNARKIVVEDPAVAVINISGNFRATNVESFVRLLEGGFPVVVDQRDDRIVLSRRPRP